MIGMGISTTRLELEDPLSIQIISRLNHFMLARFVPEGSCLTASAAKLHYVMSSYSFDEWTCAIEIGCPCHGTSPSNTSHKRNGCILISRKKYLQALLRNIDQIQRLLKRRNSLVFADSHPIFVKRISYQTLIIYRILSSSY
jgi:hypothetical protein